MWSAGVLSHEPSTRALNEAPYKQSLCPRVATCFVCVHSLAAVDILTRSQHGCLNSLCTRSSHCSARRKCYRSPLHRVLHVLSKSCRTAAWFKTQVIIREKMDVFRGYVSAVAKSQTRFGLLLFISTLVCSISLTTKVSEWYSKDKLAFTCTPSVGPQLVTMCYMQYAKMNNFPLSQMSFVLVNGFTMIGFWVAYAIYVSPTIRRYIRRNEMQLFEEPAPSLLRSYEMHTLLRVLFLAVMIALLFTFQTIQLPESYECLLPHNLTKLTCTDSYSEEKSTGNLAMVLFDGTLLVFSAIEGFYLLIKIRYRALAEHTSLNETFLSYLMDETAGDYPPLLLDAYFWRLRQSVLAFTERQRVLFPNTAQANTVEMDDIHTSVVIQQGRAYFNLNAKKGRQHNLKVYAKPSDTLLNSVGDIFKPTGETNSEPKIILVCGGAGIGKSLFCHKLLRDWAKDDLISRDAREHGSFNFVSFLKFKEVNFLQQRAITLFDLLRASVLLTDFDARIYKYILRHPNQLLILFDGLDEFTHYRNCTDDEHGFINDVNEKMSVSALYGKILKGKFLKGATVITTSRPATLDFVGEIEFDRIVEILGFSPKQVREYIERFCGRDNAGMRDTITRHVFGNENILSFCYLPVNCMLICSYLELSTRPPGDSPVLPTTMTDMCEGVMTMFGARHGYGLQPEGEHKQAFEKLCDLAKEGIESMKLTFLPSDLSSQGLSDRDIEALLDSGLLHCLPAVRSGPLQVDAQYCFTHLTIQEFLAAKRIGTLPVVSISTSVMLGAHWDVAVQFFCGLKDTSREVVQSILCRLLRHSPEVEEWSDQIDSTSVEVQIDSSDYAGSSSVLYSGSRETKRDAPSFEDDIPRKGTRISINWCIPGTIQIRSKCEMQLFAVKCLHEVQSRELVQQVGPKCFPSRTIDLSGLDLSPGDCPAIQYFLREREETLLNLRLQHNNIGPSGCRVLSRAIALRGETIQTLDLSNTAIGDEGTHYLFQALASSGRIPSSIYLARNGITATGAQAIMEVLQISAEVQDLDLGYNELGPDGARGISALLRSPSCGITRLGLAGNAIGDAGVYHVCSSLVSTRSTLVELDLRSNGIRSSGCISLANVLVHPHSSSVQTLALSGNPICSPNIAGFQRLAESLKQNISRVNEIVLSDCGINMNAVVFLSFALGSEHCNVRKVDLSSNSLGDDGCKFLSLVGLSHSRVEEINLDRNELNDEGARWLLHALQSPDCNLCNLSVGDNGFSQDLEVEMLNAWGANRGGLHLIWNSTSFPVRD